MSNNSVFAKGDISEIKDKLYSILERRDYTSILNPPKNNIKVEDIYKYIPLKFINRENVYQSRLFNYGGLYIFTPTYRLAPNPILDQDKEPTLLPDEPFVFTDDTVILFVRDLLHILITDNSVIVGEDGSFQGNVDLINNYEEIVRILGE